MNSINLIGRMTKAADLRYTQSGKPVANFTIAVDRPFNRDETDFIQIVTWNKTAENTANYTRKGSKVGVSGRLQIRSFDGQDGKKVWMAEVVADSVEFLDGKPQGGQQGGGYDQGYQQQQQPQYNQQQQQSYNQQQNDFTPGGPIEVRDDDLPF